MAKYHTVGIFHWFHRTIIHSNTKIYTKFCGREKFVMESDDIHQVLSKLAIVFKKEYCMSSCAVWLWTHSWDKLVSQVEARL